MNDGQAMVTSERQDDAAFYAALKAEIDEAMERAIGVWNDLYWDAPCAASPGELGSRLT